MDFTFEIKNNISSSLCKEIIERFENDPHKMPGRTGGGYNPEMKSSTDLYISRFPEWEDINKLLSDKIQENLVKYQSFLQEKFPKYINLLDCWNTGFQIQKSGYYRWHQDGCIEYGQERMLTFIWYLNTVEKGGETGLGFKNVKPEEGKFLFFPSTWDYVHCGFDASDKYIITGWLWRELILM